MGPINSTTSTDRELMQQIGGGLRAMREAQDLTAIEAAEQTGLARRTVYRAEHGQNPTLLTIVRLLRLYGRMDALGRFTSAPEISPMALLGQKTDKRRG